jgi:hypothetical protein
LSGNSSYWCNIPSTAQEYLIVPFVSHSKCNLSSFVMQEIFPAVATATFAIVLAVTAYLLHRQSRVRRHLQRLRTVPIERVVRR